MIISPSRIIFTFYKMVSAFMLNTNINVINKTNASTFQLEEGNFQYPFTSVNKYWFDSYHIATKLQLE